LGIRVIKVEFREASTIPEILEDSTAVNRSLPKKSRKWRKNSTSQPSDLGFYPF